MAEGLDGGAGAGLAGTGLVRVLSE